MNDKKRRSGKVAIIMAAADGFGAATARQFVAQTCRAVAADVQEGDSQLMLEELGGDLIFSCRTVL